MSRKDRASQLQTSANANDGGMTDDERYRAGYGGSYTIGADGKATLVHATQDATIVPEQHPDAPKHLLAADVADAGPAAE